MNWRKFMAALLLCAAPTLSACKSDGAPSQASPAGFATEQVSVKTVDGKTLTFAVELAQTSEEQARGLKFRDAIQPLHGMLFPLSPPRTAQFWMVDTIIPLDMLFIRTDGTVSTIQADTAPHSKQPVFSVEPVAAVLELGGGEAARLGITPGAQLKWHGFNKPGA